MEFQVGDKAVYPAHGVGEITNIETREISGSKMSFYIMKILESDMTIMIPVKNAGNAGLRPIINKKELDEVYTVLYDKNAKIDIQAWNKRYRAYLQKIKTGSVFEIAKVLRDLHILKRDKTLSYGEKRMLETAKNLLKKEIAISKAVSEEKIEEEFSQIFC